MTVFAEVHGSTVDFAMMEQAKFSISVTLMTYDPEEAHLLKQRLAHGTVLIFNEGEELPCATDHSEEWPGITDL